MGNLRKTSQNLPYKLLPQTVRNFIITNLISVPDGVGEVDVDDGETDDGIVIVGECCPCCLEEK